MLCVIGETQFAYCHETNSGTWMKAVSTDLSPRK